MAMTKAEKAYLEELETRLALRFTDAPAPIDQTVALEVAKSRGRDKVVAWTGNSHSGYATKGWFSSGLHNRDGALPKDGERLYSASQTSGGPWFHTKADAIRWSRAEMAKRFAAELRKLDTWIAAAEAPKAP